MNRTTPTFMDQPQLPTLTRIGEARLDRFRRRRAARTFWAGAIFSIMAVVSIGLVVFGLVAMFRVQP